MAKGQEGAYAVWDNMTKIGRHETRHEGESIGTDVEMPGVSWCSMDSRTRPPPACHFTPSWREAGRSVRLDLAQLSSIVFLPFLFYSLSIIPFVDIFTIFHFLHASEFIFITFIAQSCFYSLLLLLVINANIYQILRIESEHLWIPTTRFLHRLFYID